MGRSTWTVLFDGLHSTSILSNKISITQATLAAELADPKLMGTGEAC